MITYALGTYINRIPVYFTGMTDRVTPHFSSEPEEAAFGNLVEIEELKALFVEKAPQFGPYEIVEIHLVDDDEEEVKG